MANAVVHLRCKATGKIKREKRGDRDTIIVPSYAAKANSVLNDILYTKEELEASYGGLNRTPAPLGHPEIDGDFVPAMDPEALARNHIFAWNENPRWDGDRVALDVVIDEARAKESDGGRKVLEAINAGEPISTSTGLLCNLGDPVGKGHKNVARNIEWDHVAILLDEEPAISPEDGVGIFVNAKTDDKIEVINSVLEDAERDLEWAADMAVRAVDRMERASLIDRIVSAIKSAVGADEGRETSAENGDAEMADKAQLEELSAKVNALTEAQENMGETIAGALEKAMKPLVDAQNAAAEAEKAKEQADHATLVNKVVEANIAGFGKEVAETMGKDALEALLAMNSAKPKAAAPLMPGFMGNAGGEGESLSPLGGAN